MIRVIDSVDVICEHKADGTIIPLKFRLLNEDGEYDKYKISGYRQISAPGAYTTPDGIMASSHTYIFECFVVVLNTKRYVRLYYEANWGKWKLAM
ncbi:MAG: hypothetical protein K5851_00810 [Lachnospiraceae bacterium]|nr:hypothetical protein [Lachnospiraceae bacterium]